MAFEFDNFFLLAKKDNQTNTPYIPHNRKNLRRNGGYFHLQSKRTQERKIHKTLLLQQIRTEPFVVGIRIGMSIRGTVRIRFGMALVQIQRTTNHHFFTSFHEITAPSPAYKTFMRNFRISINESFAILHKERNREIRIRYNISSSTNYFRHLDIPL